MHYWFSRYIHATSSTQSVKRMFRVRCPSTDAAFGSSIRGRGDGRRLNRRLLWHGTRTANLLGILTQGLVVNPRQVAITGRAFGDGIYFADAFDKSLGYTGGGGRTLYDMKTESVFNRY